MGLSDIFIDVNGLPDDLYGSCQLVFLLVAYGYILFTSSNLISDGSELLLLVPSFAGVVGSCVLPVLGYVFLVVSSLGQDIPPRLMYASKISWIIPCLLISVQTQLFSSKLLVGLGDDAQAQLSVGVGALAGSTIMLLTLPWFLSVVGGRVNIDPDTGRAIYKRPSNAPKNWSKLDPPGRFSFLETGVTGSDLIQKGGIAMIITSVSYLIIQGPAFFLTGTEEEISNGEYKWALAGLIICLFFFFAYLAYQYKLSRDGDELKVNRQIMILKRNIAAGRVSLLGALEGTLAPYTKDNLGSISEGSYGSVETPLIPSRLQEVLKDILRPFFNHYDMDKNGSIEIHELGGVLRDLHEDLSMSDIERFFRIYDTDKNNRIDFQEFINGVAHYAISNERVNIVQDKENGEGEEDDNSVVEDSEDEEIPEDLAHLPPHIQQRRITFRSFMMMGAGTLLVLLFSDPMVEVLDEVGKRTGIPSFYISFVLAPLASNASELIAAYNYSLKKTTKTIEISLSTLTGAACMNNTFCLGVFMFLIVFKNLAWTYSAETISILFVEIALFIASFKKTYRVLDGFLILTLFPISLVIVVGLEAMGLN